LFRIWRFHQATLVKSLSMSDVEERSRASQARCSSWPRSIWGQIAQAGRRGLGGRSSVFCLGPEAPLDSTGLGCAISCAILQDWEGEMRMVGGRRII
jgi:hypothetical protein